MKNNYPLSLISNVIKNMGTQRVFTKIDLRWGYNNIRIKEGDEWAAFIDDVIVGTESEEGHDELVEEVIKGLEKNNLYVKPEKCKWKVKEVGFLGMVIGPEGIRIKEEKVKGILEWPTPMCVKDVQKFLRLVNYYC